MQIKKSDPFNIELVKFICFRMSWY